MLLLGLEVDAAGFDGVGAGVAVAVPVTFRTCPTLILLIFAMPFNFARAETEVLCADAIAPNVSPDLTLYELVVVVVGFETVVDPEDVLPLEGVELTLPETISF